MAETKTPEVWLRGPVAGIPQLLQPVAHILLQAREEVAIITKNFPDARLWDKPAGVASVGFHLQHLTGVIDRLFTYARGEALSPSQMDALASERRTSGDFEVEELVHKFNMQVDNALYQLGITEESTLSEQRQVGRAKLPSTVLGLLVHAAEHSMRHVGQLLVTVRVLLNTRE